MRMEIKLPGRLLLMEIKKYQQVGELSRIQLLKVLESTYHINQVM